MKIAIRGKYIMIGGALLALSVMCGSCKKVLDKLPENTLTSTQVYRNVYDADAAIVGLYGKFMGLAKQYVVLNELRADLMDVTLNSDAWLREITTHTVSADNPYANPRPFYSLINDCNDVLKNFKSMLATNKLKSDEYLQRYSDVGSLRSWLYLQLGIHWGKVPYVTDPLETVDKVQDISKYPQLPFTTLLDSLISFTAQLPFQNPYPTGVNINVNLITTLDGSITKRFFVDKYNLLGDLYLWRGNYTQAATYYRKLMEHTGYDLDNPNGLYSNGDQYFQEFRQPFASVTDNNDLCVGYIRFHEMDKFSLVENNTQGWRSMFARPVDKLFLQQWIWVLPFNSSFAPTNPFVDLFSNRGGSYLVKPSQQSIDNWNSQTQLNGFPFDARGNFTYKMLDGQLVIMKYLYNYVDPVSYVPINPLTKNGQWFLARAAGMHLHFAEAANRDGWHRLACALLNQGISNAFDTSTLSGRDVTNVQQTLTYPAPYNFDARMGQFPTYRGDWYRNGGIRSDAYVRSVTLPAGDSTVAVENALLAEGALELAYEGYRWPDLVRIALRRNDPSIVATAVYNKLVKDNVGNASDVRNRLMDPNNWYLPFKWK